MKKENIQSRNRKLSAKARKKHTSFAPVADMLKPLEKMYGSYAAGMISAGAGAAAMSSYYMPQAASTAAAAMGPGGMPMTSMASSGASQFGSMVAAGTLGGFGAPHSFAGMVSE